MDRTVKVWDRQFVIQVVRQSKTVWVASGEYMGETISVKDRSASTATKRWRETATYRGG